MLTIKNTSRGDVQFILSRSDARRVMIDHETSEICLPVADTVEAVLAMGKALRGELRDGNEVAV